MFVIEEIFSHISYLDCQTFTSRSGFFGNVPVRCLSLASTFSRFVSFDLGFRLNFNNFLFFLSRLRFWRRRWTLYFNMRLNFVCTYLVNPIIIDDHLIVGIRSWCRLLLLISFILIVDVLNDSHRSLTSLGYGNIDWYLLYDNSGFFDLFLNYRSWGLNHDYWLRLWGYNWLGGWSRS